MYSGILYRIIRSCFPDSGLRLLDRKLARMKRFKEDMERDNRRYYGESYYRQYLQSRG
jgi:hypothetical protein